MHYHTSCYTMLKNDARAATAKSSIDQIKSHSISPYDPLIVVQLIAFVKCNNSALKLSYLRSLYDRRIEQLESDWIGVYVHEKRFKEYLLEQLGPDWSEYSEGRDTYICNKTKVGALLAQYRSSDD